MAFTVIIVLYVTIGLMSAAGSVFIARKLFSAKMEQIFFALFLVLIAGFYLAFTAYFGEEGAWRYETAAVIAFAGFGLLGIRERLYPWNGRVVFEGRPGQGTCVIVRLPLNAKGTHP